MTATAAPGGAEGRTPRPWHHPLIFRASGLLYQTICYMKLSEAQYEPVHPYRTYIRVSVTAVSRTGVVRHEYLLP